LHFIGAMQLGLAALVLDRICRLAVHASTELDDIGNTG